MYCLRIRDVLFADPRHGGQADLERIRNHLVVPGRANGALVSFEQNAAVGEVAGECRPGGDEALQVGAFCVTQNDRIFLMHSGSISISDQHIK